MIKFSFILATILFFHLSHELIGQDEVTNISIIEMSKEEMFHLKDSFLLALNPVLLKKGNWSKVDLLQFSRNFIYEQYLENINHLKEKINALQHYESTIERGESNSRLIIKTTFKTDISKKGTIIQVLKYNLVQQGVVILRNSDWKSIKKQLKNRK